MERRNLQVVPAHKLLFANTGFPNYPPFMGDFHFHASHKRMLYFKDPEKYRAFQFFLGDNTVKPCYFWPVRQENWVIIYANSYYEEVYRNIEFFKDKPYRVEVTQPIETDRE
jgi:hypothetical protein